MAMFVAVVIFVVVGAVVVLEASVVAGGADGDGWSLRQLEVVNADDHLVPI